MSGIAGILNFDGSPVRSDDLEKMAEAIRHRGPDGIKFFKHGNVGLAHLFLRIDDTTFQPISENGVTLVLDGRIDNLNLLSRVLSRRGEACLARPEGTSGRAPTPETFNVRRSTFDERTETVLLAAYLKFGLDLPKWLLGDFALAVWDDRLKRLLLARDQIGVKPLFYFRDEKRLIFASEAKAILAVPGVPCTPCDFALEEYGRYLFRSGETTVFKGIRRLLAREQLHAQAGRVRRRSYWYPRDIGPIRLSGHNAYLARFGKIFFRCVSDRLPASGRAFVALSGGLDSSAIASVGAHLIDTGGVRASIQSISMVIGDFPNERSFFDAVCGKWRLPCTIVDAAEIPLRPHLGGLVGEIGNPFVDWIDPNLYHGVFKAVSASGSRKILMGVWGDDLMAGLAYVGDLFFMGGFWRFWKELRQMPGDVGPWQLALRRSMRFHLFPNPYGPVLRTCNQRELHTLVSCPYHGLILESLDHGAAAQGIEVDFPFLDRRLLEFVLSIPPEERVREGVGKRLLRDGLRHLLPDVVLARKDKGQYTDFWHSKLREAGLQAGDWGRDVVGWRELARKAWEDVWIGAGRRDQRHGDPTDTTGDRD